MAFSIVLHSHHDLTTITVWLNETQFDLLRKIIPLFAAVGDVQTLDLTSPNISDIIHIRTVLNYLVGKPDVRTQIVSTTDWRSNLEFNISANFLAVPSYLIRPMDDLKMWLPVKPKAKQMEELIPMIVRFLSSGIDQKNHTIIMQYICDHLHLLDLDKLPFALCTWILEYELHREVLILKSGNIVREVDLRTRTHKIGANAFICSPNGRYIVVEGDNRIQLQLRTSDWCTRDLNFFVFKEPVRRRHVWSTDSNTLFWLERTYGIQINLQDRTTTKIQYPKHVRQFDIGSVTVSPDGTLIVLHTNRKALLCDVRTRRWVRFNTRANKLISCSSKYIFSPNNRKIISYNAVTTYIWDVDCTGDIIIRLTEHPTPFTGGGICFSPDSKQIAYMHHPTSYLFIFDVCTFRLRREIHIKLPFDSLSQPTYAANGEDIYFCYATRDNSGFAVYKLDLSTEGIICVHDNVYKCQLHYVKAPYTVLIRKLQDIVHRV